MTIKTVIAVDPGINIGFARIDAEDKKIIYTTKSVIKWDLFCTILNEMEVFAQSRQDPITFVVEDFRLFSHKAKAQIGSQMDASQVIGAIKYAASRSKGKIELVMQQPSVLSTAAIWSGVGTKFVQNGTHMPDDLSAYNHGYFYLIQNEYINHSFGELNLDV
jgi:hypothetical protein